mmetsp:Transcript_53176/g.113608  ORF Transcript_53176/g.113608 Transcript_53176/m.113608 type:complete len:108 (+) Transcript_53176:1747-2070(+)
MMVGTPPSIAATAEFVVPRSIPTIFSPVALALVLARRCLFLPRPPIPAAKPSAVATTNDPEVDEEEPLGGEDDDDDDDDEEDEDEAEDKGSPLLGRNAFVWPWPGMT